MSTVSAATHARACFTGRNADRYIARKIKAMSEVNCDATCVSPTMIRGVETTAHADATSIQRATAVGPSHSTTIPATPSAIASTRRYIDAAGRVPSITRRTVATA
jgi:hypothetical protein